LVNVELAHCFLGFLARNLYFCSPVEKQGLVLLARTILLKVGEVPEWPKGTVC